MMSMLPARFSSMRRPYRAMLMLAILSVLCLLVAIAVQQSGSAKNQRTPRALLEIRGDWGMNREDYANHVRLQTALLKSRLVLGSALRAPAVAELPAVARHPDPVSWLEQRLEVDSDIAPEILRVAVNDGPAEERALLVNAVVNAYMQAVVLKEQRVWETRLAKLKEVFADFDSKLQNKRELLQAMQKLLSEPADQLDRKFAILVDLDTLRNEICQLEAVTERTGRQLQSLAVEMHAPPSVSILEEAAVPGK